MVANLLKKEGRKPSIRFEEIQSGPLSPDHHAEELTVALHELCGNSTAGTTSNNYPAPLYGSGKALSKGVKTAAMLVRLLSQCQPSGGQSRKTTCPNYTRNIPSVVVGDSIIVADEALSATHKMDAHS